MTVTPHGVDPAFSPGGERSHEYVLFVGAVQARKNPLAALAAAQENRPAPGRRGPGEGARLAADLRARGADVRGWVTQDELAELYRGAAALVLPSRYEGFGIPVVEAMASGTPVVLSGDAALREVAGDAASYAEDGDYGRAFERALADRGRFARRGWSALAGTPGRRRHVAPRRSTGACSHEGRCSRRLARHARRGRALAAGTARPRSTSSS